MKHIILIILGVVVSWLTIIYIGSEAVKESSDYQKLFAKRKNSLIIGTSRAAKLNAEIIRSNLQDNVIQPDIHNFAFNLAMSPYGSSYNQSILKKVDFHSKEEGLFIICVDPWALAETRNKNEDSQYVSEEVSQINFNTNQTFATVKYFLRTYSQPYFTLFLPKINLGAKEVNLRPSEEHINNHIEAKIASYKREHFFEKEISNRRFNSLNVLIDTLKTKGEIYIVKLPVSQQMIQLENSFSPKFDSKIQEIISNHNVALIDFYEYSDLFLCPDGNHLWQPDANKVSAVIADIIKLNKNGLLERDFKNLLPVYLKSKDGQYKSYFDRPM